LRNPADKQTN